MHLNGRVYDPLLARFTSADTMTESPFSTQGWNRYAYVGNDPLAYTDPSGHCFLGCFWQHLGPITSAFHAVSHFFQTNAIARSLLQIGATVLLSAVLPFAGAALAVASAAGGAVIATGLSGGNLSQTLKAGLIAGVTAFAFFEVGDLTGHTPSFGSPAYAENVAGHAVVGCLSTAASGGSCGSGALSGAVGSALSPLTNDVFPHAQTDFGERVGGTIIEATAGGLASVAGGGKFENGAITGAFGYLFNFLGCSPSVQKCIASDPTNAEYAKHWADGTGWQVLRLGSNVDLSDYPAGGFSGETVTPTDAAFAKAWYNVFEGGSGTQADQDAILYGNIRFQRTDADHVQIGDDTYNYSWDSSRSFSRNVQTMFLREQSGNLFATGKNFQTIFLGPTKTP